MSSGGANSVGVNSIRCKTGNICWALSFLKGGTIPDLKVWEIQQYCNTFITTENDIILPIESNIYTEINPSIL